VGVYSLPPALGVHMMLGLCVALLAFHSFLDSSCGNTWELGVVRVPKQHQSTIAIYEHRKIVWRAHMYRERCHHDALNGESFSFAHRHRTAHRNSQSLATAADNELPGLTFAGPSSCIYQRPKCTITMCYGTRPQCMYGTNTTWRTGAHTMLHLHLRVVVLLLSCMVPKSWSHLFGLAASHL
jgi:hypothetical protein